MLKIKIETSGNWMRASDWTDAQSKLDAVFRAGVHIAPDDDTHARAYDAGEWSNVGHDAKLLASITVYE